MLIFSLEGDRVRTDWRRGDGVYDKIMQNYGEVASDAFIDMLKKKGIGLIFYIEYVSSDDDENICLSKRQKERVYKLCQSLRIS